MTTQYDTKEQALEMGLFYVGFEDKKAREEKLTELMESSPEKSEIGWPQNKKVDLYSVKTPKGEVNFGIGEFRSGFDLWLIAPNGFAQRT